MKCFLAGCAGTILTLLCVLVISAQYTDARALAETSNWIAMIRGIRLTIEENATKQKSLIGAGANIDTNREKLKLTNLDLFEITESSIIILHGGSEGQTVMLIPSFVEDRVVWRCIGGSRNAMPKKCRENSP